MYQWLYKVNLSKCLILLACLSLAGCLGGVHVKHFKQCIKPVALYSTDDIEFASLRMATGVEYSDIDKRLGTSSFFCFSNPNDVRFNEECERIATNHPELYNLEAIFPTADSSLNLTGEIYYTEKWGLDGIDTGPEPTIWFAANLQNIDLWLRDYEIRNMYATSERFLARNHVAWQQFAKRLSEETAEDFLSKCHK